MQAHAETFVERDCELARKTQYRELAPVFAQCVFMVRIGTREPSLWQKMDAIDKFYQLHETLHTTMFLLGTRLRMAKLDTSFAGMIYKIQNQL